MRIRATALLIVGLPIAACAGPGTDTYSLPPDDSGGGATGDAVPTRDAGSDRGSSDAQVGSDGAADGATSEADGADASDDAPADAAANVATDAADDGAAVADGSNDGGADAGSDAAEVGSDAAADAIADGPPEASQDSATGCSITSCGAQSVCVGGVCTAARRVFVSSAIYSGNLGGYGGADDKCGTIAAGAGLGGAWKAWISVSASSPSARFTKATTEYRLLDGTIVAASWTALTSGTLAHGITLDEAGKPLSNTTTEVWTATTSNGTLYTDGCTSFGSALNGAPYAAVGISGKSDATWTEVYTQYCDRLVHLYCFEQ
jgi:hypothetical protein